MPRSLLDWQLYINEFQTEGVLTLKDFASIIHDADHTIG